MGPTDKLVRKRRVGEGEILVLTGWIMVVTNTGRRKDTAKCFLECWWLGMHSFDDFVVVVVVADVGRNG